jgi:hypothetical protein
LYLQVGPRKVKPAVGRVVHTLKDAVQVKFREQAKLTLILNIEIIAI